MNEEVLNKRINRLSEDEAIFIKSFRDKQDEFIEFICKCGENRIKRWRNIFYLKQKALCRKCSRKRMSIKALECKDSELRIREFFKPLIQDFICISQRANNSKHLSKRKRTVVKFRCKCGNIGEKRWSDILYKNQEPLCSKCALEKKSFKRELHPRWNPSITEEERFLRKGRLPEDRKWYRDILKRFNYTCQITGVRGGFLATHHLYNYMDYPDLRLDLNNGVCISRKLHVLFHRLYGVKNNTPEQFLQFIERYNNGSLG